MAPADRARQTVEAFYAVFRARDAVSMLALLHPEVRWSVGGPPQIPWSGTVHTAAEAVASAQAWVEAVTPLAGERQAPIVEGERVVVYGTGRVRLNATGREFADRWVHVWRVVDARIVAFDEYSDTAAAAAALR